MKLKLVTVKQVNFANFFHELGTLAEFVDIYFHENGKFFHYCQCETSNFIAI